MRAGLGMAGRSTSMGMGKLTLRDSVWAGSLLLLAVGLFCTNLGTLPLRDWDEATVARVAWEIWQAPPDSQRWIFPTLWGEPYFNKPPLVHGAIALAYSVFGPTEMAARLPGALGSAFSVLGLYGIGRELFPRPQTAFLSAALYLTALPVARHGRLAMLDGTVLCFATLAAWCLLRARRDRRWALGTGLAWGLLCLTKGIALGGLFGAIALVFLTWDTPRLLRDPYWWGGIALGSLPVWGWYGAQLWHYSAGFTQAALLDQQFKRLWSTVENNAGPPWYYADKLLQALPGLPIFLAGAHLAWQQRRWSWAKLVLCWGGLYFLCISLMGTKLPWYLLPVYPPLAIAGGAMLTAVLDSSDVHPYPRTWAILFIGMGAIAGGGGLYFGFLAAKADPWLGLALLGLALTVLVSARLVWVRDRLFVAVLLWGTWVSLWLLFQSAVWNWELNEAYPVRPVATALVESVGDRPDAEFYTSFAYERPSLNFYSNRRIVSRNPAALQSLWKQQSQERYFLVEAELAETLRPAPTRTWDLDGRWQLLTRTAAPSQIDRTTSSPTNP